MLRLFWSPAWTTYVCGSYWGGSKASFSKPLPTSLETSKIAPLKSGSKMLDFAVVGEPVGKDSSRSPRF